MDARFTVLIQPLNTIVPDHVKSLSTGKSHQHGYNKGARRAVLHETCFVLHSVRVSAGGRQMQYNSPVNTDLLPLIIRFDDALNARAVDALISLLTPNCVFNNTYADVVVTAEAWTYTKCASG